MQSSARYPEVGLYLASGAMNKKGKMMRVPDYIGGYTDFLDQMRYMRMGERERLMFRILWLLKLHRSKLRMRQLGITIDDKPKYYGANTDSKHGISR